MVDNAQKAVQHRNVMTGTVGFISPSGGYFHYRVILGIYNEIVQHGPNLPAQSIHFGRTCTTPVPTRGPSRSAWESPIPNTTASAYWGVQ